MLSPFATEKQDYQVNTKLCQNSVMDSCKVLVNGNMSVLQTQFKSSKIKAIEYGLCDENGNGVAYVLEVPLQEYTVTELEDWSWRNPGKEIEQTGNDTNQNIIFF